jgi:hypothetical protein
MSFNLPNLDGASAIAQSGTATISWPAIMTSEQVIAAMSGFISFASSGGGGGNSGGSGNNTPPEPEQVTRPGPGDKKWKDYKEHYIHHRSLLERVLGKHYPKWKVDFGDEFLQDLTQMIESGDFQHQGVGTLKADTAIVHVYRDAVNGLTLILRTNPNGEYQTLLVTGEGLGTETAIQMIP